MVAPLSILVQKLCEKEDTDQFADLVSYLITHSPPINIPWLSIVCKSMKTDSKTSKTDCKSSKTDYKTSNTDSGTSPHQADIKKDVSNSPDTAVSSYVPLQIKTLTVHKKET